ncbi:MAG: hypothetical protein V7724_05155 [Sediminicola sp.]|tara:strand:+ start:3530 stop:4012 length:483 start_codon:yes stop_codon:yes gene_type:complete
MQHILIPTDFTVDSLEILTIALEGEKSQNLNITLVYGAHLSSSITDLLFFSKSSFIEKLQEPDFNEALAIIRNKYADRINSLRMDLFLGRTHGGFRDFVERNGITKVYIPKSEALLRVDGKKGFNLLPFLRNIDVESKEINYNRVGQNSNDISLSKLLIP